MKISNVFNNTNRRTSIIIYLTLKIWVTNILANVCKIAIKSQVWSPRNKNAKGADKDGSIGRVVSIGDFWCSIGFFSVQWSMYPSMTPLSAVLVKPWISTIMGTMIQSSLSQLILILYLLINVRSCSVYQNIA